MAGKKPSSVLSAHQVYETSDDQKRAGRPGGVTDLPVDRLTTNPLNKRTVADEDQAELEAMADTIRTHGVLQPLTVVTASTFTAAFPDQMNAIGDARWVTLIGNRRLLAARLAGQVNVPGIVNDGRAESMFEVMLVENGHRKDLAPLREAEAMRLVLDQEKLSQAELARRVGRTEAYVTQRLHLLGLIPALREALDAGALTLERGRKIGAEMSVPDQEKLAAAGPPYEPSRGLNGVKTRVRRPSLPSGDPAAAARSIREVYSGEQLAELVRLLSEPSST